MEGTPRKKDRMRMKNRRGKEQKEEKKTRMR